MSRVILGVALFCGLAAVAFGQPTGRVVSVQIVHRHGDRSPIHIPPKYAAQWAATGLVAGQLSSYGDAQLQALGAHLRAAYVSQDGTTKLLPAQYRDGAVYARSTDVPRTLASVNTLLSALWRGVTVVPIHTLPTTEDRLLQPWGQCASYSISGPVARNRVAERISKEKPWLVDGLRKAFEWPETMTNGTVIEQSLDNMLCMYAHDYTLPDFVIDNEEELRAAGEELVYALLGPDGSVEEDPRGPVGGELTRQIVANMENAQQAPLTLYSAHDTTIVALTASLGILMPHQRKYLHPAYASSIKFEVREQEDGKRTVHAYFGFPVATGAAPKDSMDGWEYEYVPIDLKCPDVKAQCDLADFSAYIKLISPEFGTDTYCCARTEAYYERKCDSYDTPFSKLTSDCQTFRKVCPAVACGPGQMLTHERNCVPAAGLDEKDDKALNTWRFVAVASIAINAVAFVFAYYLSRKLKAPQSHHVLIQDDLERGASQRP